MIAIEDKEFGFNIETRRLVNNVIVRINEEYEDNLLLNLEEEE